MVQRNHRPARRGHNGGDAASLGRGLSATHRPLNPLLPGLTGTKLSLDTVRKAAEHPNIHGIKCSGDIGWTRTLLDLKIPNFRVIVAQPNLLDVLMRCDVREHLDGVFALHPHWISEMAKASEREDWDAATVIQRKVVEILNILV